MIGHSLECFTRRPQLYTNTSIPEAPRQVCLSCPTGRIRSDETERLVRAIARR